MATPDLTSARWRKSSYSNGNGGDCVELAQVSGLAAVRDSKNPTGPALVFARSSLAAFLSVGLAVSEGSTRGLGAG